MPRVDREGGPDARGEEPDRGGPPGGAAVAGLPEDVGLRSWQLIPTTPGVHRGEEHETGGKERLRGALRIRRDSVVHEPWPALAISWAECQEYGATSETRDIDSRNGSRDDEERPAPGHAPRCRQGRNGSQLTTRLSERRPAGPHPNGEGPRSPPPRGALA